MTTSAFFAHSRPDGSYETWTPLESHLDAVAGEARESASAFGARDWGYLTGLWHDVGKYHAESQRRIRGESLPATHAGAGAALARRRGANPLAFVIAVYHAGLANPIKSVSGGPLPLRERLIDGERELAEIEATLPPRLAGERVPVCVLDAMKVGGL